MLDRMLRDEVKRLQANADRIRRLLDEHEIHNPHFRRRLKRIEDHLAKLIEDIGRY